MYFFSSNILCFGQKKPIKEQIFETFNDRVKICQIPYVDFETTIQFLLEILHHSSVSSHITSL